jgi:hypothetical protein
MTNSIAGAYALVTLTPIIPGEEHALRTYLSELGPFEQSPFAKVPSTHFARWVVIPQLIYEGPPQKKDELKCQYLLFTGHFDGEPDPWIESVCTLMSEEADGVWGHCVAYPGSSDVEGVKRYFKHNQLTADLFYSGYFGSTVQDVKDALAFRSKAIDFAVRAQEMDPTRLRDEFRQSFGKTGSPREAIR